MSADKVKVKLLKDQRWSFGSFSEGQTIDVDADIAKTMIELEYGVYLVDSGDEKEPITEDDSGDATEEDDSELVEEVDYTKFTKKDDLEAFAKEKHNVDLDKRLTIKGMIGQLESLIEEKELSEEGAE